MVWLLNFWVQTAASVNGKWNYSIFQYMWNILLTLRLHNVAWDKSEHGLEAAWHVCLNALERPFISHEVGLISPPRTEDDGRLVSRFPNNKSRRLRVVWFTGNLIIFLGYQIIWMWKEYAPIVPFCILKHSSPLSAWCAVSWLPCSSLNLLAALFTLFYPSNKSNLWESNKREEELGSKTMHKLHR